MGEILFESQAERGLTVEDFSPFSPAQIKYFYQLFDSELLKISKTYENEPAEVDFINGVTASTSRLLARELRTYHLKPPRSSTRPRIVARLPIVVSRIQELTKDKNLAHAMQPTRGLSLESLESMVAVMDVMGSGIIALNCNSGETVKLKIELEDYAAGLVRYMNELAKENNGLLVDDHIYRDLAALTAYYNRLQESKTADSDNHYRI
jgi:hypothetical protein